VTTSAAGTDDGTGALDDPATDPFTVADAAAQRLAGLTGRNPG
jgi:hypothetical protein